jgi:hypothetical protein
MRACPWTARTAGLSLAGAGGRMTGAIGAGERA